jgi:hypothetical protein
MERCVYFYPKKTTEGPVTDEQEKAMKQAMIMEFTQLQ